MFFCLLGKPLAALGWWFLFQSADANEALLLKTQPKMEAEVERLERAVSAEEARVKSESSAYSNYRRFTKLPQLTTIALHREKNSTRWRSRLNPTILGSTATKPAFKQHHKLFFPLDNNSSKPKISPQVSIFPRFDDLLLLLAGGLLTLVAHSLGQLWERRREGRLRALGRETAAFLYYNVNSTKNNLDRDSSETHASINPKVEITNTNKDFSQGSAETTFCSGERSWGEGSWDECMCEENFSLYSDVPLNESLLEEEEKRTWV